MLRRRRTGALFSLLIALALLVGPVLAYASPVIAAGFYHSLYLQEDGTLLAWGDNGYGQVGNGTTIDQLAPKIVLNGVAAITAGGLFSMAADAGDRSLRAWGSNHYGQLGTSSVWTPKESIPTPQAVQTLGNVSAVSGGGWHSLALLDDGTVWAWGRNDAGQLGIDSTEDQPTPVQVKDPSGSGVLDNIVAISAGGWHSMALSADGTVYVWGDNTYGQLGDGTADARLLPVALTDLSDVKAISAGYFHSLAVYGDGHVAAWGDNEYGQLGVGTTDPSNKPLTVPGLQDVESVSAGHYHSIALKEDGTVWTWGDNSEGQLGIGDTLMTSNSPVQVVHLTDIQMISAGGYFNLALALDGSGWSWGWNEFGQLGDGTNHNRSTPIKFWDPNTGTPPTSPGLGRGGGGGSGSPASKTETAFDIDLYINDVLYEEIPQGSLRYTLGQRILTVTLDEERFKKHIGAAGHSPVVVIKVHTNANKVTIKLSDQDMKQMMELHADLEIHTGIGNVLIPISALPLESVRSTLGGEPPIADGATLSFHISEPDREAIRLGKEAEDEGTFTLLAPPVQFSVTVTDNAGEETEITTFRKFVKREIPLPDDVQRHEVTTAVILLPDGSVRHVPTATTYRNGRWFASTSSLSNSHYMLISNAISFSDARDHWAEAELEDFASRLIIFGTGEDRLHPDRLMTRAELTAMLVRALGISLSPQPNRFSDVSKEDWYADVIGIAEHYGLVMGYDDGTFRPNDPVTRQEAIVMIYRAAILAGIELNVEDRAEAEGLLTRFIDGDEVSDWAKQEVASVLKLELVIGANDRLMPHKEITRAEQTVIVWRFLKEAGFID